MTNQNLYIFITRVLFATKLSRMMTYLKSLLYKATRPFDRVVLQDHVTTENHYVSNTIVTIATKLDRTVTYLDKLLLLYSLELLIA